MSKTKRKQTWTAFEDVTENATDEWFKSAVGASPSDGLYVRLFVNSIYQVIIREGRKINEDAPKMLWLSIKAIDKSVRHDWREFQRIKNELAGEEWEAVEIYPAESRLVDTSNQYHLWAFEPPFKMPFGFNDRIVMDAEEAEKCGAKQRAFKNKPSDLTTFEKAASSIDF